MYKQIINHHNIYTIMKKIIMSLGFAAATVLAAQAQEMTTEDGEDVTLQTEEVVDAPADEMQEGVQEVPQDMDVEAQASTQQIGEEEGVMNITQDELPEEVMQAFQDSEYAGSTIEATYALEDLAIDKLMEADAEQMYIGDQLPDKLYEIRVNDSDEGKAILYFDETGELLGSKDIM